MFPGHQALGAGSNLAVSSDGRHLVAGEFDPGFAQGFATRVWDTRSYQPLPGGFNGAIGGALAPDGVTVPFGYGSDTVLWNARTGRIEQRVPHTGGLALATVSPDGHRIAVSQQFGSAEAVAVYDLDSHHRVGRPVTLHGESAYPLGFLPDGRLVTTGPDNAAIWTLGKTLPPLGVRLETGPNAAAGGGPRQVPLFLPGLRAVLTAGSSRVPLLHDPATGRVIGTLLHGAVSGPPIVPPATPVVTITASPDGRLIAGLRTAGGGVGIWDATTHALLSTLPGTIGMSALWFSSVLWSPAGHLIAATIGGYGYLWNVANPRHPAKPARIRVPAPDVLDDLIFTPDGHRLVTTSASDTRIALFDIATGHILWTAKIGGDVGFRQLAVSPDGATIAVHSGDSNVGQAAGQVTLLDTATGHTTASFPVPSDGGIGYLNHGKWLVSTSNQPAPEAQLYDATTRQPIGVPFPTGAVDQDPIVVDPSGTRFAQIIDYHRNNHLNGTNLDPFLWNADPTGWVTTACTIAGRNLTQAEWHQYLPDRSYHTTCPQWPAGS
jgi:WD40 repeat protein